MWVLAAKLGQVQDSAILALKEEVAAEWLHQHPQTTAFALDTAWGSNAQRRSLDAATTLCAIGEDGHMTPVSAIVVQRCSTIGTPQTHATVVEGTACGMEVRGTKLALDRLASHDHHVTMLVCDGDAAVHKAIKETFAHANVCLDRNRHLREVPAHVYKSLGERGSGRLPSLLGVSGAAGAYRPAIEAATHSASRRQDAA